MMLAVDAFNCPRHGWQAVFSEAFVNIEPGPYGDRAIHNCTVCGDPMSIDAIELTQTQLEVIARFMNGVHMNKYRKKPVVIEAVQWNPQPAKLSDAIVALKAWGAIVEPAGSWADGTEHGYDLLVVTTEGKVLCRPGWWIIKGVEGEFYPCAPTVFDATYEAVAKE